jgi:hypothetical protein
MRQQGPDGQDVRACSRFVFEMVDWLIRGQIQSGDASSHHLVGGYSHNGRVPSASTATYTEAVIRGFGLAMQLGELERSRRYRDASLLGLGFVARLQIAPATVFLFPHPAETVGGTSTSFADMTIRCDNDQHAVTAYLAALENAELFD